VVRASQFSVCCLVLVVSSAISRTAEAASPNPSPWSGHFGIHGGITSNLEHHGFLGAGVTGLLGYRALRVGALAEDWFGSGDGRELYTSFAAVAGVAPSFGILRLDALATAGVHNYRNLTDGYDTGPASEGPEASSGFLGTRLGAALVLLNGPHLELGAWFIYENDLRRDTVPFPMSNPDDRFASVGSEHVGLVIGAGVGFDFGKK
jgi:hypothetical protein